MENPQFHNSDYGELARRSNGNMYQSFQAVLYIKECTIILHSKPRGNGPGLPHCKLLTSQRFFVNEEIASTLIVSLIIAEVTTARHFIHTKFGSLLCTHAQYTVVRQIKVSSFEPN